MGLFNGLKNIGTLAMLVLFITVVMFGLGYAKKLKDQNPLPYYIRPAVTSHK
jgi:hypothetical protein